MRSTGRLLDLMASTERRQHRHRVRGARGSGCEPRARALQRLVRAVPALAARPSRQHGTLQDVEARLPYIAAMGFDVLYLPPIHPIGRRIPQGQEQRRHRGSRTTSAARGPSAARRAGTRPSTRSSARSRTSSAWSQQAQRARHRDRAGHRLPVRRPTTRTSRSTRSGSARGPTARIQYAENPPKKYQDIYPFDFESRRLAGAVGRAAERRPASGSTQGVRIFRVDNPHTKPFAVLGVADRRGQARASRT